MSSQIWPRSAGVLLHISSLPGPFPIGDFGESAKQFIKFLQRSKLHWWQVLPLNALSGGHSPYSSISSFALEPMYIDVDLMFQAGLIDSSMIPKTLEHSNRVKVDFEAARASKYKIYQHAFQSWLKTKAYSQAEFNSFCEKEKDWLDDFAFYCALSEFYKSLNWIQWPKDVRLRQEKSLLPLRSQLAERILYFGFLQYFCYKSWNKLKAICKESNISILGDLPIYQDLASCDVWVNQEQFQLNPLNSQPIKVSGVPPDAFNENGQKWGHPLYDWEKMANSQFTWWKKRIKHQLKLYDAIRLDHFIGFYNYWSVPAKDNHARNGEWLLAKGKDLLGELQKELSPLPIVAEDLGEIHPEVIKLRDKFHLPGMKLVHFGFGETADLDHLPHRYRENFFAYPGTHDNDTTRGWFRELKQKNPSLAQRIRQYFRSSDDDLVWSIITTLYASVAHTVIVPMQDILGMDSDARLNFPGKSDCKWDWRMIEIDYSPFEERLASLANLYEREMKTS